MLSGQLFSSSGHITQSNAFLKIGYNSRADYMNRVHCLFGTLLPSSILANTKSVLISIYVEKAEP